MQQTVHNAMMDGMSKAGFEGSLNLVPDGNLSLGCSLKEGSNQGGFVGERQVLVASSAFAWSIEGSGTKAVVARDDGADSGDGDARVKSDALSKAWLDLRVIDNAPAGLQGDVGSGIHLALDCFCREMGSSLGESSQLTSRDDNIIISYQYATERALV